MAEQSFPFPGITTWRTAYGFDVWRLHYESDPVKGLGPKTHVADINMDLSPWALKEYQGMTDKALYRQEYEIDFEATQGTRLFYMDPEATLVRRKDIGPIPHHWTRWYGLDPHPRVPHSHLWCAVDPYGDRYYYRELWPSKIYGMKGNLPEDDNRHTIKDHLEAVHYLESAENDGHSLIPGCRFSGDNGGKAEKIFRRVIDYAARAFGQGTSDDPKPTENFQQRFEKISREIGKVEGDGWHMNFRDCVKDMEAGIALVNEGLKPLKMEINGEWKKRSRIHIIEDNCPELVLQIRENRYPKLTPLQADTRDPISDPIQKRRHGSDILRYIEMDKPRYIAPSRGNLNNWEPLTPGINY